MKHYPDTAQQPKIDPVLYAAGYHLTPGRIAMQRVKAYIAVLIALAAVAGGIHLARQIDAPAVVLLGLAVAIGCAIYAITIVGDTENVRRQLWQREDAAGQDFDGDGHIGQPQPASRTVRVRRGDEVGEIVLDMPARSSQSAGPLLVDFGVTAPDLVSFLFEADLRRGLQERNWIGDGVQTYVLPSGQRVSQSMFRQIIAGLSARGLAVKTSGRWELDCDPEAVAEQLKPAA